MRKYDGRVVGLLGALILHLTAAIIFLTVKIGKLNIKEYAREYEIVLEDNSEPVNEEPGEVRKPATLEQIFSDDPEMLNIARNIANRPDVQINADDYVDKVKEELIDAGLLKRDNFIDEQRSTNDGARENEITVDKKSQQSNEDNKPTTSQEMAANYSGPTRIYYNLPGRVHTYLPIPIYKCEGSGKVVLRIEVNTRGTVTSAKIITSESTTNDPCLTETAVNSALVSRFNSDLNGPKTEEGTLTYLFVAQ
jgi:hypothetical protein